MAGAKYLSESLKDKRKLMELEAQMESTVIGAQSALVQGGAEAARDSADSQADSSRQQAYGQIESGAASTGMAALSLGVQARGSMSTSGLKEEADLNQQMADRLRSEPTSQGATTAQRSGQTGLDSESELAPRGPNEPPRTSEEAHADLAKLFGKGSANTKVISEDDTVQKEGRFITQRKISETDNYGKAADRVTDKATREEYANKFENRAKIQNDKVNMAKKETESQTHLINSVAQGIAGITSGSANVTAADSQSQKGQEDAAKAMFDGTEQSRQATQRTLESQTNSARDDIKQQIEMMRRLGTPN
ncbi:MAG: hypothetical protein CME32_05635 [Gimesia sp.]|nr:hypothetical protein [Gimesia sp.]